MENAEKEKTTEKDEEVAVIAEVKNNKSTDSSVKNSSPKTPKTTKNKGKAKPSEENLQSKVEVVTPNHTPLIKDSIMKTPEPIISQGSKRKTSDVPTPQSEASSPSEKIQKLTPKQLARKAELEKKRQEKEK